MRKYLKYLYRYLLYVLAVFVQKAVQIIPREIALRLGSFGGCLCFFLLQKERDKTLRHLGVVFDNKSENYRIAMSLFRNLGMNLIEWLWMPRLNKAKMNSIVNACGIENIKTALANGKGAVVITGHFGNWEYIPVYMAFNGYKGAVVARRIYYQRFDRLLVNLRKKAGVETLWRDGSVRHMLRILKNNELLGILPDQDTDKVDGIFVDFLGQQAYTPTGPVSLALATGASIVPCFIVRKKSKHYLYIEKPLELEVTGNKEADIRINTEKWSYIFEKYIREYPDQWVWMHKRWNTKNSPQPMVDGQQK